MKTCKQKGNHNYSPTKSRVSNNTPHWRLQELLSKNLYRQMFDRLPMQTAPVLAFLSIKPFPLVLKLNLLCCRYLTLDNRLSPSPLYFLLHTKLHCFLLYFSFYPENLHFFTILMILIVCLSAFSKGTCHLLPNLVAQYRQGCCSFVHKLILPYLI